MTWGQAYRDGSLVCSRVHVTFGRDDRIDPAPHQRRTILARFEDRLHLKLRNELTELAALAGRRGAAARRAVERIEPIVLLIGDPRTGRQRLVGRIVPPQDHRGVPIGELGDVEFRLRELDP